MYAVEQIWFQGIKEKEVGGICNTNVSKREGDKQLRRIRSKCEDNIEYDLKEQEIRSGDEIFCCVSLGGYVYFIFCVFK